MWQTGSYTAMQLTFLKWKIGLKKCAEFEQNSQKWCAEFLIFGVKFLTTLCIVFLFFIEYGAYTSKAIWTILQWTMVV